MNEDTPNEDTPKPNEAARTAIERMLPKTLRDLEELLENGGKRTIRVRCKACGETNTEEVRVADADLLVKAASMLSSTLTRMQAQKGEEASVGATKLLHDRSDLTDAELAEYIAKLEAELA